MGDDADCDISLLLAAARSFSGLDVRVVLEVKRRDGDGRRPVLVANGKSDACLGPVMSSEFFRRCYGTNNDPRQHPVDADAHCLLIRKPGRRGGVSKRHYHGFKTPMKIKAVLNTVMLRVPRPHGDLGNSAGLQQAPISRSKHRGMLHSCTLRPTEANKYTEAEMVAAIVQCVQSFRRPAGDVPQHASGRFFPTTAGEWASALRGSIVQRARDGQLPPFKMLAATTVLVLSDDDFHGTKNAFRTYVGKALARCWGVGNGGGGEDGSDEWSSLRQFEARLFARQAVEKKRRRDGAAAVDPSEAEWIDMCEARFSETWPEDVVVNFLGDVVVVETALVVHTEDAYHISERPLVGLGIAAQTSAAARAVKSTIMKVLSLKESGEPDGYSDGADFLVALRGLIARPEVMDKLTGAGRASLRHMAASTDAAGEWRDMCAMHAFLKARGFHTGSTLNEACHTGINHSGAEQKRSRITFSLCDAFNTLNRHTFNANYKQSVTGTAPIVRFWDVRPDVLSINCVVREPDIVDLVREGFVGGGDNGAVGLPEFDWCTEMVLALATFLFVLRECLVARGLAPALHGPGALPAPAAGAVAAAAGAAADDDGDAGVADGGAGGAGDEEMADAAAPDGVEVEDNDDEEEDDDEDEGGEGEDEDDDDERLLREEEAYAAGSVFVPRHSEEDGEADGVRDGGVPGQSGDADADDDDVMAQGAAPGRRVSRPSTPVEHSGEAGRQPAEEIASREAHAAVEVAAAAAPCPCKGGTGRLNGAVGVCRSVLSVKALYWIERHLLRTMSPGQLKHGVRAIHRGKYLAKVGVRNALVEAVKSGRVDLCCSFPMLATDHGPFIGRLASEREAVADMPGDKQLAAVVEQIVWCACIVLKEV